MMAHMGLFKSVAPTLYSWEQITHIPNKTTLKTPKKMTSSYKIVINYDFA
jgi:hypothetical protein